MFHVVEALPGYAPLSVALEQEVAWGNEKVDVAEMCLNQTFPEKELLCRVLRKALVAPPRRLLGAKLPIGPDELTVVVADRKILVQGKGDWHVRQGAANRRDQFGTEK